MLFVEQDRLRVLMYIYIFYLTVPGLSCGTQDLSFGYMDSLVVVSSLFVPWYIGS